MALAKAKKSKEKAVVTAAKYNNLKKEHEELKSFNQEVADKCMEAHLKFAELYDENELLKTKYKLVGTLHNKLSNLHEERSELADAEIAQLTEDLQAAYEMTRTLLNRARQND